MIETKLDWSPSGRGYLQFLSSYYVTAGWLYFRLLCGCKRLGQPESLQQPQITVIPPSAMALPEAPKTPLVIRHFYPIHPQTALQQQSAVYSTSDNPLVAPILSVSSQPLRSPARTHRRKRKIEQVDSDIEYLGTYVVCLLSHLGPVGVGD
jgi:hypothetical protein